MAWKQLCTDSKFELTIHYHIQNIQCDIDISPFAYICMHLLSGRLSQGEASSIQRNWHQKDLRGSADGERLDRNFTSTRAKKNALKPVAAEKTSKILSSPHIQHNAKIELSKAQSLVKLNFFYKIFRLVIYSLKFVVYKNLIMPQFS